MFNAGDILSLERFGNTEVSVDDSGTAPLITVRLYESQIVTVAYNREGGGTVRLDSCGYPTATTKRRMNEALEALGIKARVFQRDGAWYVTETHPDLGTHREERFGKERDGKAYLAFSPSGFAMV